MCAFTILPGRQEHRVIPRRRDDKIRRGRVGGTTVLFSSSSLEGLAVGAITTTKALRSKRFIGTSEEGFQDSFRIVAGWERVKA